MFFYDIAHLGRDSPLLTYQSDKPLQIAQIVQIQIRKAEILGVIIKESPTPSFVCKHIEKQCGFFNQNQKILAFFIAHYYRCSLSESFGLFVPFAHNVDSSLKPHFYKTQAIKCQRFFQDNIRFYLDSTHKARIIQNLKPLNDEQQNALKFLESKKRGLIFGDTGSGKTEIYFHLIARAIARDKSALFLMPEISLTPQILQRLESVFGDCVGIWHSKLSKAQKQNILAKLESHKIKIIAGARSALFLPLANLGIIIIDEEHDDAYKSFATPRYNARDVALFLGQKANIQVILGSATPSLSSYVLAKNNAYLFRLKGRFFQSQKNFILEHSKTELTPKLLDSIHQILESKKQIIVFLPTRANFKSLLCYQCGYGFVCPHCSVNMSVHIRQNTLCCHYCGYTQAIPRICPKCGSSEFSSQRIGTAQIAQEIQEYFTQARIGIFDRDHITTHNKLTKTLNDFNNGTIDILIGTQMLSKGHDYHNVALAVILGIDYVLNSGDFRGFEKGVALLHQIAGRSGRKENGKVFIQSLQIEWIEQFLGDYEDFLLWELAHRSKSYPPFSKLAMIHCDDSKEERAKERMLRIVTRIQNKQEITIIGYGKNAIEKITNKYRYHILLCAPKTSLILRALEGIDKEIKERLDIDIDVIDTL